MGTIEDAKVEFADGEWVWYERINIRDNGWLGVFTDDSEWNYYPPHKISRVRSL